MAKNETSISNIVSTSISNTRIDVSKVVDNDITNPVDTLVYSIYFNNILHFQNHPLSDA